MPETVIILGGGGHAKVVISALQDAGYSDLRVLDDDSSQWGTELLGVPIGGPLHSCPEDHRAVIAIGDNRTRKRIADTLKCRWLTVTHRTAYIHPSAKIGVGTVVFAGSVIQPETKIGDHVIVNTGATIDHDCSIGDYVHIAPGCSLAGNVRLAEGAFVGIGSSVIPGCRIGAWTKLGAGAVVIKDIPDGVTAVGVPADIKQSR